MNLESFLETEDPKYNPIVDNETWKRIRIAVCAYAYEFLDTSLISDFDFDSLAQSIDLNVDTRRPDLDEWFRKNFNPSTGFWIHHHPELNKIALIAKRIIQDSQKSD